MRPSGNTMMGGTFTTVSAGANKFCFRDLSVKLLAKKMPKWDGWEWTGGCKGFAGFCVDFLGESGAPEKTYYWQYFNKGESETVYTTTLGWFKDDGTGKLIPLTDTELDEQWDSGTGFWIFGNGNSLVASGSVSEKQIEFETRASGNTSCGNGTPVELTLGDLSVTLLAKKMPKWDGWEWTGGCKGFAGFCVDFLGDSGAPEKTRYWQYYHKGDAEDDYQVIQGWFKDNGEGKLVPLTDAELAEDTIPAGQAMWIFGNGNTLNVPAPELTK